MIFFHFPEIISRHLHRDMWLLTKNREKSSYRLLLLLLSHPSLLGCVLHVDDSVEGPPPSEQLHVHLALDVHEDQSAREADRHNDQLRPEGPLEHPVAHLLGCSLDQHIQGPHHTRDGHHVERDGTKDLALLNRRHLKLLPLERTMKF